MVLAKYGWFIDIHSNQYLRKILKKKLDEENIGVVNTAVTKHYKKYSNDIIEAVCDRHPQWRNFIAEQVMSSYSHGHYELAIIGLFRAIDGICGDKHNLSFFIKKEAGNKKYIPAVARKLIEVQNDFYKIFITPILDDCPIFVNESRLDLFPSKLNRHAAVHGRDIAYGTEENFLRSLSLLKYVSDMLYFSDICTKNGGYIERYMYPN